MPHGTRLPPESAKGSTSQRRRLLVFCAASLASLALLLVARSWIATGDIRLLVPEQNARWIRRHRPFSLAGWGGTREVVVFHKSVTVPTGVGPAVLTVRALKSSSVFWDGQLIDQSAPDGARWKEPRRILLPTEGAAGEHTLDIQVENTFGPAAMLAHSDALDLRTGSDWEIRSGGLDAWQVSTVDDIELPEFSYRFASPLHSLRATLWWIVPLFLTVWWGLSRTRRNEDLAEPGTWLTAACCRWVVIAAWFVLAANNFTRLPTGIGYDLPGHVDYIRFVAELGRLPDARDGTQMFQAPLYYGVSAAVYRLLTLFVSSETALVWLRWIPLSCGLAQVEICYRAGRRVFPRRDDAQALTVLIGGLLPMNIYMSQVLGNEPLSGLLSASVLLLCWQGVSDPDAARRPSWPRWMGLVLGLALLTKMSAVLLAPVVAGTVAFACRPRRMKKLVSAWTGCFGTAAIVSGWYYARNWVLFGKPFIGGWDAETGLLWWQDPGYRTPQQMASFGNSLFQPVHAGFFSIWDGFYTTLWLDGNLSSMGWESRPWWNETLLLSAPWPALVLTFAIAAGALRACLSREKGLRISLLLAVAGLSAYGAAFAALCLTVPAYSQAKASYTLGLTPAFAVLCVAGLDLLPRNRPIRSAVTAFVVCWSVLAYGAYFVLAAR